MDYEKKYKDAVKDIKTLFEITKNNGETLDLWFNDFANIIPELKESEDERIREKLIDLVNARASDGDVKPMIAWLEKQEVTDEEIIFRPVVGTDIRMAAKQALEKIDIGKKVVLAFNGAYILVNGKTVGEIDSEYDAWLKKQGESKFEQCVQDGDKIVANEDGTRFNISQLERVAVSEDLEEAAKKYGYSKDQVTECGTEYTTIELIRAFIDGAKWQEMKYKTEKCDKVKLIIVKEE